MHEVRCRSQDGAGSERLSQRADVQQQRDLLDERREPLHKRKGFASVAVKDTDCVAVGFLVESEVHPGHEPTELNQDPGALVSEEGHDGRQREIRHRQ